MRHSYYRIILLATICIVGECAFAGGPWATEAGHYNLYFGYSRKTAVNSWDGAGNHVTPDPSTYANGLRHDFRYAYLNPTFGIATDLEVGGSFLYLWGYESSKSNPDGSTAPLHMEYNPGLTDMWLYAKYQILHGEYPLAVMVNSRFPDLYDSEGPYTRYMRRIYTRGKGPSTIRDTQFVASPEWRGVLKRDLGIYALSGHSFGAQGYAQAQLGYVLRQGAFADQLYLDLDGGYNLPVLQNGQVTFKAQVDYTGGLGNGGVPDEEDRFGSFDSVGVGIRNNNFNNGKYARVYLGGVIIPSFDWRTSFEVGIGWWVVGAGAVQYQELYFQTGYAF